MKTRFAKNFEHRLVLWTESHLLFNNRQASLIFAGTRKYFLLHWICTTAPTKCDFTTIDALAASWSLAESRSSIKTPSKQRIFATANALLWSCFVTDPSSKSVHNSDTTKWSFPSIYENLATLKSLSCSTYLWSLICRLIIKSVRVHRLLLAVWAFRCVRWRRSTVGIEIF